MNHSQQWFICFSLVVMVFIGLSCGALDGGGTEVFLVKDADTAFHCQWNEAPVTDRIILSSMREGTCLSATHS